MGRVKNKAFIFCEEDNVRFIIQEFFNVFKIKGAQNNGNKLTLTNKDYKISITALSKSMNEEIKKFIDEQIISSCEHFSKIKTKYIDAQINLLHEIEESRGFITIEYSYKKDKYTDKDKSVFSLVFQSLKRLKGILIYDNGRACYTYYGKTVLDYKGDTETSNFMPFINEKGSKTLQDDNDESVFRRKETLFSLRDRGIYVIDELPIIPNEEKVVLKSAEEIAKRLIALLTISVYSESLAQGKDIIEVKKFAQKIINKYEAQSFFTPKEIEYLQDNEVDKDKAVSLISRYESLYVIEWLLGYVYDMPFPEKKCDAAFIVKMLLQYNSIDEIVNSCEIRDIDTILRETDLMTCLNWACEYSDKYGLKAPKKIDKYIVYERYKSFKWLTEDIDWDDIDK